MRGQMDRRPCTYCGVLFAGFVLSAMGYLSFAALQGDHGFFRLVQVEAQETQLAAELEALEAEHATIANRVRRLATDALDLDLLDERARAILGLARPDEIVIR
jgi:cell division protein FtsB